MTPYYRKTRNVSPFVQVGSNSVGVGIGANGVAAPSGLPPFNRDYTPEEQMGLQRLGQDYTNIHNQNVASRVYASQPMGGGGVDPWGVGSTRQTDADVEAAGRDQGMRDFVANTGNDVAQRQAAGAGIWGVPTTAALQEQGRASGNAMADQILRKPSAWYERNNELPANGFQPTTGGVVGHDSMGNVMAIPAAQPAATSPFAMAAPGYNYANLRRMEKQDAGTLPSRNPASTTRSLGQLQTALQAGMAMPNASQPGRIDWLSQPEQASRLAAHMNWQPSNQAAREAAVTSAAANKAAMRTARMSGASPFQAYLLNQQGGGGEMNPMAAEMAGLDPQTRALLAQTQNLTAQQKHAMAMNEATNAARVKEAEIHGQALVKSAEAGRSNQDADVNLKYELLYQQQLAKRKTDRAAASDKVVFDDANPMPQRMGRPTTASAQTPSVAPSTAVPTAGTSGQPSTNTVQSPVAGNAPAGYERGPDGGLKPVANPWLKGLGYATGAAVGIPATLASLAWGLPAYGAGMKKIGKKFGSWGKTAAPAPPASPFVAPGNVPVGPGPSVVGAKVASKAATATTTADTPGAGSVPSWSADTLDAAANNAKVQAERQATARASAAAGKGTNIPRGQSRAGSLNIENITGPYESGLPPAGRLGRLVGAGGAAIMAADAARLGIDTATKIAEGRHDKAMLQGNPAVAAPEFGMSIPEYTDFFNRYTQQEQLKIRQAAREKGVSVKDMADAYDAQKQSDNLFRLMPNSKPVPSYQQSAGWYPQGYTPSF
jgi:hypothetical protein